MRIPLTNTAMAQENHPSQCLDLNFSDQVALAVKEIHQLPDQDWIVHVNTQAHEGQWSVLPLRTLSQYANAHPILQSFAIEENGVWQDLPRLKRLPTIKKFLDAVKCDKKSVRLMQLAPAARIKPHRDAELNLESGEARLHVPLQFCDSVEFTSDNKKLAMQPGDLWYINADQPHAVTNNGLEARINLVIDCTANEWLHSKIC